MIYTPKHDNRFSEMCQRCPEVRYKSDSNNPFFVLQLNKLLSSLDSAHLILPQYESTADITVQMRFFLKMKLGPIVALDKTNRLLKNRGVNMLTFFRNRFLVPLSLLTALISLWGFPSQAKSQIQFYKTKQNISNTAKVFSQSLIVGSQAAFTHASTASRTGANVTRVHAYSATGFQLSLQNENSSGALTPTLKEAVDIVIARTGSVTNIDGNQIGEVQLLPSAGAHAVGDWKSITFSRLSGYLDPVVVFQIQSNNEASAAHIRVRNLTPNSLEYRIEEWNYLDDAHVNEAIAMMVVENGTHILQSGKRMVAGVFVNATIDWLSLSFSPDAQFDTVPAVVSQVVGQSSASRLVSSHRNVSLTGMDLSLENESTDASLPVENIHVIAVGGASYLAKLNFKKSLTTTVTDPKAVMADFVADASPAQIGMGRYGDFVDYLGSRRITASGGTGNSLWFDNVIPATADGRIHKNSLVMSNLQLDVAGLETMTIGMNIYSTKFNPKQVLLSQMRDPVTGSSTGTFFVDTIQRVVNGTPVANQEVLRFYLNVDGAWRFTTATSPLVLKSWKYHQFVFDGRCIYILSGGGLNGTKNCFIASTLPTGRITGNANIHFLIGAKYTETANSAGVGTGAYPRTNHYVGELDEISIYDKVITIPPDICRSFGPLPSLISATRSNSAMIYNWRQYMPEKSLPLSYSLKVNAPPGSTFVTTTTNFTLSSCQLNTSGVPVCSRSLVLPYELGKTYTWTIKFNGEALNACPNRAASAAGSFVFN